MSEWSSWLALLVYAQARGGSTAAGWTALGLLVPAMVVAPFVGRLADGPRPIRTLVMVYIGQACALAVAAALAWRDAPVLVVTVPAAVAIGGIAFVRPSFAVISPGLVRTARELAVSNLFAGYCDSGSVLLGPIIATGFLALGGPELVLLVCAVFGVVGAAATAPLLVFDRPVDAVGAKEERSLRHVVASVRSRRNVPALLAVLASQHVLMGFIGVMFVIIAVDELGMSGSGAGVLNIAFGLGAVCSTMLSTLFVGRGRIAAVVAMCLGCSAVSMLILGGVTTLAVALVALPVAGLSRSLLDVLTRILLQRSAPPEYLATVFAFIEVLTSVGLALGTMIAQLTVATIGPRGGLVMVGLLLLTVLAFTVGRVRAADHGADVPVVVIALLRSNPVFAPLPPAALESVSRSASERLLAAGEVLITEGEAGDAYFVTAEGELDVRRNGTSVRHLHRGEGVGEVALLTDVPRTATVIATGPSVVWEVDREPFLLAVTGHEPSRDAIWRHIRSFDD